MATDVVNYNKIAQDLVDTIRFPRRGGISIVLVDETCEGYTHRRVKSSEFKDQFPYFSKMSTKSQKWIMKYIKEYESDTKTIWIVAIEKPGKTGVSMTLLREGEEE